jgi:2,4-dienoyl-CoA reductase-like NADH-dependent reductase (Old Yellow Enzyme family)
MRTFSEQFLAEVEAFLAASRMKATDFGREAVGDPSFVTRLRQGRSPSLATADKVRACMRRLEARSAKAGARR